MKVDNTNVVVMNNGTFEVEPGVFCIMRNGKIRKEYKASIDKILLAAFKPVIDWEGRGRLLNKACKTISKSSKKKKRSNAIGSVNE